MLDFRRDDGSIKDKSLYTYVKKHADDPEVKQIFSFPGTSTIAKYKAYLKSFRPG